MKVRTIIVDGVPVQEVTHDTGLVSFRYRGIEIRRSRESRRTVYSFTVPDHLRRPNESATVRSLSMWTIVNTINNRRIGEGD